MSNRLERGEDGTAIASRVPEFEVEGIIDAGRG